jgi:ABC-2 type transport system permease protein
MKAIVRWTIWQRRWSILWWCIGVVTLVTLTLAFYPSIKTQAATLNKSFGSLSSGTLNLFGGTDFFSPLGYLNSQLLYFTVPLILAILAIGLGTSLVGREESSGTLEGLLARPVSRGKILAAKAIAGLLIVLIVTFVTSVTIGGLCKLVHLEVPLANIAVACLACYLLILTFGASAFLLTATGRGRVAALGIAVAYGMGGYVVSSLAPNVHWLKGPSLIFPYHYYRTADILKGTFVWSSIAFFVLFILGCGVVAWMVFRRRDLASE